MKKAWILIPMAAIASFAIGATALPHNFDSSRFADRPLGRLLTGRIGRLMALKSELNLSDEQKAAIAQTLADDKQEIAKAIRPVVEKARALRAATSPDAAVDDAKIHVLAADLGQAIGDAAVVGAHVRHDIQSTAHLSEEQMKKVADFHLANQSAVDQFLAEAAK
ncbi:MAG TPA: hypothetical protein VFE58_08570 [Tepidisphaeraceae bacterium]|jgi:hypothetical protein|nr:hypothetical protein [Tepidisphaeraceae bacterium]